MSQVSLRRLKQYSESSPRHRTMILTRALPYFLQKTGLYVHRVRAGHVHFRDGQASHTSIWFWCGNLGSMSQEKPGKLYATPPEGHFVCATCEGRAIGAGETQTREINGIPVMYSPRKRGDAT